MFFSRLIYIFQITSILFCKLAEILHLISHKHKHKQRELWNGCVFFFVFASLENYIALYIDTFIDFLGDHSSTEWNVVWHINN